LTYF